MKFKSKSLKKAVAAFTYNVPETTEVELSMREEDISNNKLCDCLMMVATWDEAANKYEDNQNPTTITQTIEVFPENENRPPKITVVRTRDVS